MDGWRCGWGGAPCSTFLPRRGLCEVHSAAIREAAVNARVDGSYRNGIRREPAPPRRIPVALRAAQLGRIVHAAKGRMSKGEAAAALGMASGGSVVRVIRHARDAGWIVTVQGPDGGLDPGDVKPPAAE